MSFAGLGMMAASAAASIYAGNKAKEGAEAQAAADRYAADLQEKRYQQNVGYEQPYMKAGTNALNMYGDYLGTNGTAAQSDAMKNFQSSPYMTQMLKNAADNTTAQYSAKGAVGGNMVYDLYKQNASMWDMDYQKYLDRLNGVAGIGATATNSLVGAGTTSASNQGNYIAKAGEATGAGIMGQGNAIGNAINSAGVWSMMGGPQQVQNWWNGPSASGSGANGMMATA